MRTVRGDRKDCAPRQRRPGARPRVRLHDLLGLQPARSLGAGQAEHAQHPQRLRHLHRPRAVDRDARRDRRSAESRDPRRAERQARHERAYRRHDLRPPRAHPLPLGRDDAQARSPDHHRDAGGRLEARRRRSSERQHRGDRRDGSGGAGRTLAGRGDCGRRIGVDWRSTSHKNKMKSSRAALFVTAGLFAAFAPVSLIATVPYVLVANPAFPAAGIREFIASARADPDKYTFASSGTGATGHLVAELFNSMAGIRARHVPYKGSVPAITDLLNGNVTYAFETLAATAGHVKSGRLKAYGISSARRNDALPEVAPVHESAELPGFEVVAWIGYLAPAGTPPETRARLAAEVRKAVQAGDLRERYAALGMDPVSSSPEDLGALLKREHERYAAIVKRANIRID